MTVPEINYIAVVLATLSSMVVGAIWYAPRVFGSYWMKQAGIVESEMGSAVRPSSTAAPPVSPCSTARTSSSPS